MTLVNTFRLRLKEFLEERGISVYSLIKASGLAPNTLYAIARGSSGNARLDTIAGILSGLRRLTGEDVSLADIVVEESAGTKALRAAPKKLESVPTSDDDEWLEAFRAAAKSTAAAPPYREGSVVLVQFDGQVTPCVTLTRAKTARDSGFYGVVPLVPRVTRPIGRLTPSFSTSHLPASSTALCTQVQTVELTQVVGFVRRLGSQPLKRVRDGLTELLALERAADGRYNSAQQD